MSSAAKSDGPGHIARHCITMTLLGCLLVLPGAVSADILKNPREIEPVTGASLGMGWDTTRKKLANVCIDESSPRLSSGEVAVDTSPNVEEFSMVRSATEMSDKMGLGMEVALSAMTGIGRISNETKAGLLKQTSMSRYSLTLVGRSRETVPEFLDKEGLRLKAEAARLLESEIKHPQFRDRCGDSFVLGWLKGHELVARLEVTEQARKKLREMNFENNLGIASGNYDLDTLIEVSKSSEMASVRQTVDVKVYRTDSKRTGTDYSDPEAFQRTFFEWQSRVDPADDGQIVALFVAPYRGNIPDYPPREYLAARTAESYLGWIADALWQLKAAEEDARYVAENPGQHALAVREATRQERLAAVRRARDAWAREYETLKSRGAECLQTLKALRAEMSDKDALPELPDFCVETAERYRFDRHLARERDRILPPQKSAECGPTPIAAVRGEEMTDEPLSFDIDLAMNVQPTGNSESNGNMRVNAVMTSKVQGDKLLARVHARAAETAGGRSSSWQGQTGWFELLDLKTAGAGIIDKRNFSDCLFHELRGKNIEVGNVDGFIDYDWQPADTPWGQKPNMIGWIDDVVKKGEKPPRFPPTGRESRRNQMLYEAVADDRRSLLHKIYCELDTRGGPEELLRCERIRLNPARISLISSEEYAEERKRDAWSRPVAGAEMPMTPERLQALIGGDVGDALIATAFGGGESDDEESADESKEPSAGKSEALAATNIVARSPNLLVNASGSSKDGESCKDAIQNKIAWNHSGSKQWAASNIDKLCGGVESTAPAECFRTVMHSGRVDRSDDGRWNWQQALALCKAARRASARIDCYRDRLAAGMPTPSAIRACN